MPAWPTRGRRSDHRRPGQGGDRRGDCEPSAVELGDDGYERGRFAEAEELFARVALADEFPEFLTLPAYEMID